MSQSAQYIIVFCLLVAVAMVSSTPPRTGYPRPNRGFKSQGLSTARGFGKRDPGMMGGPGTFVGHPVLGQGQLATDVLSPTIFDLRESYPTSWLIEEMQNNPEVARVIVEKVVDENGDGELTPDELFKRIYV